MAGSGQLTNDELLKLINQTSSPEKHPDLQLTNTSENKDISNDAIVHKNLNFNISSKVEHVKDSPDVSEKIPNDSSVHGNSNLTILNPVEDVTKSVGIIEAEGTTVAGVTHSDMKGSVDIDEDLEEVVDCDRCHGEGVVKKKHNTTCTELNSPSDCCSDVDLVSILSKDELTNLIQEYRAELEDSKNKLKRSDRLLAKANDYNTTLRNMVEQLSSDIHRLKHMKTCDVYVQVDKDDFLNYTTGAVTMPSWYADNEENVTQMDVSQAVETDTAVVCNSVAETEGLSIADSIKQAAEAVVQEQQYNHLTDMGYVYDEQSGLYYHPASGYYYDQNKSLFYDPKTGIYYYFDYNAGTYEFHSQVELQQPSQSNVQHVPSDQNTAEKLRHKNRRKKEKVTGHRNTPDKKIFKNRRERRQAVAEGGSKQRSGSASNDRHRSRDRNSKKKKRRKYSNSDSECSPSHSPARSQSFGKKRNKRRKCSSSDSEHSQSHSPAQSRSSGKKSKRNRKERKVKSAHEDELEIEKPKQKASAEGSVMEVSDASDNDANNSIQCFRNMLKLKSSKSAALKRSGSAENLCTYRKTKIDVENDVNNPHGDIDGRQVRAQSESRIDMYVSSSNSEDGETLETETIGIDSGENESASKEALNAGKKTRKSGSDEKRSKRSKSSHKRKKKHKKKHHKSHKKSKKRKRVTIEISDTESGELSDSDIEVDEDSLSDSNSSKYQDVSDDEGQMICSEAVEPGCQELATNWPPCIRIMVTESDCVQVGTFFMITCTGGKIGRENCDVNIPDLNISKTHAQITYKADGGHYEVMDLASQNGTLLNQQRLSPAKIASEAFVLKHSDIIQVGSTLLLCHIHPGTDTCDQCEPGVVLATLKSQQPQEEIKVLTKEERLRQKKLEMKQIKKKYGLKNSAYEDNKEVFNNPNYTDKAEERRKTVGSDNPGQKHETPASVHRPISTGNVGHKLLQKMGWKEGESLGKHNTGLQEPISVNVRANQTAGLGSSNAGSFTPDNVNTVDMKKASRRVQAQQRYKQIESDNPQTNKTASNKQWKQGDTEYT